MDQTLISPEVFAVFAIGGVGTLMAAAGLWLHLRASITPWKAYVPVSAVLMLLASAAAFFGQPAGIWGPLVALGAWSGLVAAVNSERVWQTVAAVVRRVTRPQVLCVLALLASPAFAFVWPSWVDARLPVVNDDFALGAAELVQIEKSDAPAITDTGREVPLFYDGNTTPSPETLEKEALLLDSDLLANQMIRTGAPDSTYNCHGWIFTGGLNWVKGNEVEGILADNDYHLIGQPQVGDLAVYRDDAGEVSHTAIVRATGEQGFILLESKWGRLGRYIHAPSVQPYAAGCTYYRSPRHGHLLNNLPAKQPPVRDIDVAPVL